MKKSLIIVFGLLVNIGFSQKYELGKVTIEELKEKNKDLDLSDLESIGGSADLEGCNLDLSNYEGIMKAVVPFRPLQSEVYTNIKGNNPSMPLAPYSKLKSKELMTLKVS
jgi:hypothetical protein